ncbi:hypothetical protein GW17_00043164 [Ensete ventricosum]|nr:hypothetical protein GW17_00043164 [Ensete ventricosum]RZR95593.1 hypothetical protein BHM03_00024446 [Ensete ventricosum]
MKLNTNMEYCSLLFLATYLAFLECRFKQIRHLAFLIPLGEHQIVFADAWWIGQKEENPQELQLELPKYLSEVISYNSSGISFLSLFSFSYAESSGDDSNSRSDAEQPATSPWVTSLELTHKGEKIVDSCPSSSVVASTSELVDRKTCSREKLKQTSSSERSKGNLSNGKGKLVQATLSTLFEKEVDKKPECGVNSSPGTKGKQHVPLQPSEVQLWTIYSPRNEKCCRLYLEL